MGKQRAGTGGGQGLRWDGGERVQLQGRAEREKREQEWEEVNISSVYTRDSLTVRVMKAIDLHSSPAI